MIKSWIIILITLLLALGIAGIYTFRNENNSSSRPTEDIKPQSNTSDIEDTRDIYQHIKDNPKTVITKLAGVTETSITGTSYVLRNEDGLEHLVESSNMPNPDENKFYEGWLVTTSSPIKFISTGKMTLSEEGDYFLYFTSKKSYGGYDKAVITLETKDDGKPEVHILE